ncbi:50S ribosomal protein L25/general stress protein Ctc [Psychrosphaera sp. B3R10]|uniref:Large ribosomal subunit protein bL25 n=1 Tax=Psychrosphaera algicola TaxID=3023714 RepID=A0ABT5F9G8_9GAMM|nr:MULTISPECIES: 50S ribosomal protein L25/general stress protein Ctc [unclassified Psychrosphaera]MBU2882786.1 50S ribosomal protein L25/general stress protein Ctc [Psychrosphaera sp. I2R16]MBU2988064.1 50S ribosomal protein L25/general stress protein Ctc [Psychrosphaera sp. B3R10]MDC2888183.1 50S ribosomal protein L25/general stress protein Ctc [Psychrosphaera sp. G1-22]
MSEAIYTLEATVRSDKGTGASRRLRHDKQVPAIIYGADKEPQNLALSHNKVWLAQENEGFYSHILTLVIDGAKEEVILKDMQRHPWKNQVLHLDFQRVDAKHKLHTKVPVHFVGEEAAIKKGGVITHVANELEITCLPKNLPEFIEVNVADMEVGQTLHISEITLPAGVESVELTKGESHDNAVVTLHAPKGAAAADEDSEEAADAE